MKTKYVRNLIRAVRRKLAPVKRRALLWLARHSVLFNQLYLTTFPRRFLIVKVKLINFYHSNLQPRLEAVKARLGQARQRLAAWLARHRRRLQTVALVVIAFTAGVALAVLWQQSPALRRVVATAATGLAAAVTGLWGWLRGRPAGSPEPVIVGEAPRPEPIPLRPEPDGRL